MKGQDMKKSFNLFVVVALLGIFASGCASAIPMGSIYTEVSFPGGVGNGEVSYSKFGKATSNSYFALIAAGDSSIETAAKNGGITNIKFVDYKAKNILGIFGEYTTYVYGD
jgi:hypothetical protein